MTFISGLSFLLATASYPGEVSVAKVPEVDLALGYTVKNREIEALDGDNVFLEGDRVVAWTSVTGMRDGFIEHIWYKDGEEMARHYLPVGAGRRWRTWTRHEVEQGDYVVKVLAPDGALLKEISFAVDVACGE